MAGGRKLKVMLKDAGISRPPDVNPCPPNGSESLQMNVHQSGVKFRFTGAEKRLNTKYANRLRPPTDSPAGKDDKYIFVNSSRGVSEQRGNRRIRDCREGWN